ncbi:uncharacterized protein LOC136095509 [Hydra vulgaris]|uniref:uncharacterized protein LOC136095509 n=1 Tax=Hydra vulgaris TaxID=6087 RepID=UPI0032EA755F
MNISIIEYKPIKRFDTEESLSKHKLYCDTHDSVRIELPKPNTMIKFNHFKRSMRVPFVVYADFESFIKPINTCTPNPDESYTKQYQKHTPSSFCYYIKCFDESIEETIEETIGHNILATFTAESEDDDVAQIFVDSLEADIKKIYNKCLKFPKNMIFTPEDKNSFNNAKVCHICERKLKKDRVRDHCHITGKYRGAAHNDCNLHFKIPKFIPVFFHNLTGYDSHLFIKKLSGDGTSKEKINCIPINEEKYISFSKEIKVDEFTKSYKFKGSNKKSEKKVEVKLYLLFLDSYRFMASSLDSLIKNSIKENYKELENKKLNLLLRKVVYPYEWVDSIDKLNETQLPPKESFYSRLNDEGISDEDYLHAQNVWKEFNCETFKDYHNLYNVADEGIRGGISMVSNRIGTANNKYIENYDESKESTYIQYLDANNLYGWAMKVDLEYPEHLHDVHNDYPLAPERLKIDKVDKLVPNLNHKKNYVIHYENLYLYERLGMKLTKVHRGIKFEESAWLSKYINLNTDLRTKATNDFEKDFFKLMNNSVFGKTIENIEKRVDVRLVSKRKKLLSMSILSKTLVYEFHYDYIKNKYEDRAKLLYTDTDSLIYEIKTEDFYADIANDIESKFDTSEFNKDHPAVQNGFKVGVNKKVLGMFKDESAGKQIAEFIGLRSKLYSYKIDKEDKKRCKGVKRNVVKNYITHEDYKDCLMNRKEQMRKMNVIRSHLHDVYTEEINKIALSAEDDKRVIQEDGIHTLAYGHYKLVPIDP